MPSRFRTAAALAVDLVLIGLFVAALLIGAIQLALPFSDLFRSELEAKLSETLGMEVRIGQSGLRLAGLTPRLRLQDAVLLDPDSDQPRLELDRLWVDLNPIASLVALAPRVETITLTGVSLAVKRLATGELVITGLENLAEDPRAMQFFLGNGSFRLADSRIAWSDEKIAAPPLRLSGVDVRFQNQGERHQVHILARRLDERQVQLRLVGDLHGAPHSPGDWSGELYLRWQGDGLGRVLAGRLPPGLRLESDAVELESWNRLQDGQLSRSLNRIQATGLEVWTESAASESEEEADPHRSRLDQVGGLLRWRRLDAGWRLQVDDLAVTRDGARRPVSDLDIRFTPGDAEDWTIAGGNRFIDLADARDLLMGLAGILPQGLRQVGAFRPGGGLRDLRFRVAHRPESPLRWAASGRLSDLSLEPHGDFPGVRGLAAEAAANQRGGELFLSGDDPTLDLPQWFPDPIGLDQAGGEIRWRRETDGALRIGARGLTLGNADVTLDSRFTLTIPAEEDRPILDLHTEIRDLELARVPAYLPVDGLHKDLDSWLRHALVGGKVPHGVLSFQGVAGGFPFDDPQGRFQAMFAVQDAVLKFDPDWPPIRSLGGELRFEDREMRASFTQGRFLDNGLSAISARIPDVKRPFGLDIRGRAEGPFADSLRALAETPMREQFGVLAEILKMEGRMRLDLDLTVPFRYKGHKGPLRLAGELGWPGPATLAIPDQDIRLVGLAGKLGFTEDGLHADAITAELWGAPVSLRVATRTSEEEAVTTTHILTAGRFPVSVLARQFPAPVWRSLQGETRLALDLAIPGADFSKTVPPLDFDLKTDLAGLALRLPEPLGKPAAATRRLRLSGRFIQKQPLRIQGRYGDLGIDLELDPGDQGEHRLVRGLLNLGGPAASLPEPQGLHLRGSIAALDLGPWLEWRAGREQGTAGDDAGGESDEIALSSAQVQIGRLALDDMALDKVDFDLRNQGDHWETEIEAPALAGEAIIPHRPRDMPVRVRLQRLDLKALLDRESEDDQAPEDEHEDEDHADPRRAHALDLAIEQLQWGGEPLGSLTLVSQAVPEGLEFNRVSLTGPAMSIQGQGGWLWTDAGPRSKLSLEAKGPDLEKFLDNLELENLCRAEATQIDLDLSWPGAPGRFKMADLEGRIWIRLRNGSLPEVEPGAGRILGILNLEAIQRRLTLDFNDLFSRGYTFKKITGRIHIQDGIAAIEKLRIEGPAADIEIVGTTNLRSQAFNQVVTVTPHIGTGVAVAGVVAGGPLVGAAVFLVDQAADDILDKLGRYQYYLGGTWDAPEIRRGGLVGATPAKDAGSPEETAPAPSPSDENEGENLFLGDD